ncbi:MAG: MBL fold metallo-hydrolase [Faecalicoccus sp.]|nr:MBL fold metallo-hydrolase [Faecalicoccus sp.]
MQLETSLIVPSVKLRYFAFNCLEIKLPDDKTLVIDPCLNKTGTFSCGYDVHDLEGCDYVLVNHSHGDHVDSLGEIYDAFHPLILAHAHTAQDLATFYDIPYIKMVPFTHGDEFLFDSFQVKVVRGRHNTTPAFLVRPSGRVDEIAEKVWDLHFDDPLEERLSNAGSMYNSNFLITLSNNVRIGFCAGNPGMTEPEDANLWRRLRPDIIFAQRAKWSEADYAEKMSNVLSVTGARIMVPIHIEDAYKGEYDPAKYVSDINKVCEEKGLLGRAMFLERAKWYQFTTGVSLLEK